MTSHSKRRTRILCVSIEASGDLILAAAIRHLKLTLPLIEWVGIGGPRSRAEGLVSILNPVKLAAHGLTEALHVLPATLIAWRRLKALAHDVDGYLLVDAPELNVRLLKWVKGNRDPQVRARPVVYLAPPQAWAWRAWRARPLALADRVGCLFNFEMQWWRKKGSRAFELGHLLSELGRSSVAAPIHAQDANPSDYSIALFPGSRASSVSRSLPLMIEAAALTASGERRSLTLYLARSEWVSSGCYHSALERIDARLSRRGWERAQEEPFSRRAQEGEETHEPHQAPPFSIIPRQLKRSQWRSPEGYQIILFSIDRPEVLGDEEKLAFHPALASASLSICHAGTSTLEAALSGRPPITIAPLSKLSAWVAQRWVKIDYFSLPNLILGALRFPELPPSRCEASSLADEISLILGNQDEMKLRLEACDQLRARLLPLQLQEVSDLFISRFSCLSLNSHG